MENLARTDLNPLEEARAMDALCPRSSTIPFVCASLGRSSSWVSQRRYLLTLPPDVQERFANREVSISRIYSVCKATDPRLALHLIKTRTQSKRDYVAVTKQKRKTKREIRAMVASLMGRGLQGIHTRLLSWANGDVSDADIQTEIGALKR